MRTFLAFLESRGAGEISAREIGDALAGAEREALVAEGVLRAAPLATTFPCEGIGCAREVRERPERAKDGARRFLAVCTRHPRECETLRVEEAELAQEAIVIEALLGAVRRALGIDPPLRAPKGADHRAQAGAETPVLLGEQVRDGLARDVFFARKPAAPALRTLLAERRTAPRSALVLIPTARGIEPEVLARHGAGHVEIAALSDVLTIRKGRIAAATKLRVVPAPASASTEAPANDAPRRAPVGGERFPRAKAWRDVTFYCTDRDDVIGVEIDRRHRRLTASDLGMMVGRTSEPVRAFRLLQRICEGNGVFDTRPWGGRENGKQIVSELRRALSKAFEIGESPIEAYSRRAKSWKPKFRAMAGPPAEARAMERMLKGGREVEE